jgi:hypothetical protein
LLLPSARLLAPPRPDPMPSHRIEYSRYSGFVNKMCMRIRFSEVGADRPGADSAAAPASLAATEGRARAY